MALTAEWRGRIEQWRDALGKMFYKKLDDISLKGFVTNKQLSAEEADKMPMRTMPIGTKWGKKWEYAWFKCEITTPHEAKGKRIVMRYGPESAVWTVNSGGDARVIINGVDAGELDWAHREITLSYKGVPGQKFKVLFEVYAGHGPHVWHVGPLPEDGVAIPEVTEYQRIVEPCSVGIWEEEIYQAWMDLQTLLLLRDNLDADSLRVEEIDEGLRDFTTIVNIELPFQDFLRTLLQGRKRLKPLLECKNGSTSPLFYCFGHSHIDIAWLWPLQETERKCARTFSEQLALMEEYREYKFLQSQAYLYNVVKEKYPSLYKRIKKAVRAGKFIPEGGMWVEADTNVTGGESLIRQFMYGIKFFDQEFGVKCRFVWLPDVFGYSGALPQIMAKCGLKYFSTQKIFWTYNGGETFPYNTFLWEGIDGTSILSHIHNDYNSQTDPATLIHRWKQLVQKNGRKTRLVPFGYGDGGGGPTRTHLEFLRRQKNLEGAPRTIIAHPVEFFEDEENRSRTQKLPVYTGELYYQAHRGTYTTQSKTKRGNRKCEIELREVEMWGAIGSVFGKIKYPYDDIEKLWKNVLLNQFHDIIPGSSIRRVYEEAEALYARTLEELKRRKRLFCTSLISPAKQRAVVFNSLAWPVNALVKLPNGWKGATDANGNILPSQQIGENVFAEVKVPSCGWTTIARTNKNKEQKYVFASKTGMENDLIKIKFNKYGEITSMIDKRSGKEIASSPLNAFRMYRDTPRNFEAWDIDSNYHLFPVQLKNEAKIRVISQGPLAAVVEINRVLGNSRMSQQIWLRHNSSLVEFRTAIDWKEKHKLLKVCFPVNIHANEALHEIQFGHIARPNHKSRPFDADRFEVCNQKWTAIKEENCGCAVLNDCKYGINVDGNSINLTLLRAPLAPDHKADQSKHEFTYAFYSWDGSFIESDIIRKAYEVNVNPYVIAGEGGERSVFALSAENIVIETIKPSEDGSGDIVIRFYEAKRASVKCTVDFGFAVKGCWETDLLENPIRQIKPKGYAAELFFYPFEIKTIRIRPD